MSKRLWFYLASFIIIAGELVIFTANTNRTNREVTALEQRNITEQKAQLKNYLEKQTSERKLISYAKLIKNSDRAILQMIADRAYEINPNSRDVVLFASAFHSELKDKVLELDPLYTD